MNIIKSSTDRFNISLNDYELELMLQILLAGQKQLNSEQYELKKSIQNTNDESNLKESIKLVYNYTEQETAANFFIENIKQELLT